MTAILAILLSSIALLTTIGGSSAVEPSLSAGATAAAPVPQAGLPGRPIFTFDGDEPAWNTVDDDVMGGVSSSTARIDPVAQRLIFGGDLSLENNGGFASTRSSWTDHDLDSYDGVLLRLRGDGRTYRLRIYSERTGPAIAYTSWFTTTDGEWQEVYVPFAEMLPLYRGFLVPAAGPLNPADIRAFGLMLADKQEGPFNLEVDWINAAVNLGEDALFASTIGRAS